MRSKSTARWVLAATVLGSSMAFIDGTVVNVALPVLQAELNASSAGVQWVVEGYALFLAALILVGGSLGDNFGRRRMFVSGVAVFAAASAYCGLAPDVGNLVVARCIQGVGGALLVPNSLAIINAAFEGQERGRAIGTWSGFTAITSAVGPALGGVLVEQASWRWVFFINLPLAALVLAIVLLRVHGSRDESGPHRLDWLGALLATLGLGSLTYGLILAGSEGIANPLAVATIGGGIAALGAFLWVEARSRSPMMPLALFRSRTFSGANLLTFLLYAALGGALYFFPFNLIQVQNYSPTIAGIALLPFTLIMFAFSRQAGGLIGRFGARRPLIVGPAIAALGFALFALPGVGGSYWTTFFPAVVVLGIGMTITVAPLTTAVMSAVDTSFSGAASGVNNALSRAAGLLAIAMLGVVMQIVFVATLTPALEAAGVAGELQQAVQQQAGRLAAIEVSEDVPSEQVQAVAQAVDTAFVSGFRAVMLVAAGLALASALSAAVLIEDRPPARTADTEHHYLAASKQHSLGCSQ